MISVTPLPAFDDNYIWVLINQQTQQAAVIDPGEAAPVEAFLSAQSLNLVAILITHHHPDHTGGIDALTAQRDIPVYGPDSAKIPQITHSFGENDSLRLWQIDFSVLEVPGHTLDHIAFYAEQGINNQPALFCGDTLFAAGCGRIFEGNHTMMLASLDKLATLPPATVVYCAHEYTLGNLAFANAVEPDNADLQQRTVEAKTLRQQGLPTVPSLLSLEQATNPFLRCRREAVIDQAERHSGKPCSTTTEVFAVIRRWKDNF